jgi:DNA-binding SARP family transcriptional activator
VAGSQPLINLNVALYALRRAAFPRDPERGPFVEYRHGAYTLASGVTWWIDRDEFTRSWTRAGAAQSEGNIAEARAALEHAAGLYRGRLFEDDPSGEWFFAEQRLLEERFLLVLERLASLQIDAGELEPAEETLRRAVARDACRESAHRLLMRCYGELHQHQLVTRQFQQCVEALRRELGVAPHPETVETFRAITGRAR